MSILDFLKHGNQEILTKSANIESNNLPYALITNPQSELKEYLPKELIQYNLHWVYICNNKNANTCASIPLKLYYENKTGKKVVNNSQPVKGKVDVVEILEHPILDIIKNVNPTMNYTDLASLTFSYLGLLGNSFWYIEKNGKNVVAIHPWKSEDVTIKMNDINGEITSYKYHEKTYSPDDVIQFSNYNPGSLVQGKGELEAVINAVKRYCYYDLAEQSLNKNNSRPDFIVSYKSRLSENERSDVEKIWFKKFNRKGLGKPLITSECDVKPIGLSPKDMEYRVGREAAIKEILAGFGVPEALVFLNSANLASATSATSHYYKYTIFPKMARFVEKLNEKLMPLYDDNLYLDFERNIEADATEQAGIYKTYVDAGIMTVNEVRDALQLPPIEEKEAVVEVIEEDNSEKSS